MKVKTIAKSKWHVAAHVKERTGDSGDEVPLEDFFNQLNPAQYGASRNGLFAMFTQCAEHGPQSFNTDQCHLANREEGIYEFIRGDLRVLWFYAKEHRSVVVCTQGLIKKQTKAHRKEVNQAVRIKKEYERDRRIVVDQGE